MKALARQSRNRSSLALEYAVTLAQGLTNAKHTLCLIPNDDGPLVIKAFRVYRPPLP